MIPQENNFHTIGSTPRNTVEAFNIIEKIIIEIAREKMIMYGLNLSVSDSTDAHKITGRSGSTQGARIVKTHAKNETTNNHIILL